MIVRQSFGDFSRRAGNSVGSGTPNFLPISQGKPGKRNFTLLFFTRIKRICGGYLSLGMRGTVNKAERSGWSDEAARERGPTGMRIFFRG